MSYSVLRIRKTKTISPLIARYDQLNITRWIWSAKKPVTPTGTDKRPITRPVQKTKWFTESEQALANISFQPSDS